MVALAEISGAKPLQRGPGTAGDGARLQFAALTPEAAAAIAPQWAALAERAVGDNLFFHPDFALPAIKRLACDVRVATVAASGDRLVAVAPIVRTRLGGIAPAFRLWSHDYGPLGLPLIGEDAIDAAVAALVEGLAPSGGRRSLIIPELPLDGPVAAAMARFCARSGRPSAILGRNVRAALDRPAGGTLDLKATLATRRRKELDRQMRRLNDLGPVRMETAVAADDVREQFEAFLVLEAAGWKGRRGTALAARAATASFAREAVQRLAADGLVRIDSINVGGRPVAMVVALVAGKTVFTWKIAHDEAFARFSPGAQLMRRVAGGYFDEPAIARIDSCATADHPMIDRLWPGRMAVGTLVIGPMGGGAMHGLALAAARAAACARVTLRGLLGRWRAAGRRH